MTPRLQGASHLALTVRVVDPSRNFLIGVAVVADAAAHQPYGLTEEAAPHAVRSA